MRKRRVIVKLADNNYGDALNKTLDLISGKQNINVPVKFDTSQIQLPSVKVEPSEKTFKAITTTTYIIGGSLTLLAISLLIPKTK